MQEVTIDTGTGLHGLVAKAAMSGLSGSFQVTYNAEMDCGVNGVTEGRFAFDRDPAGSFLQVQYSGGGATGPPGATIGGTTAPANNRLTVGVQLTTVGTASGYAGLTNPSLWFATHRRNEPWREWPQYGMPGLYVPPDKQNFVWVAADQGHYTLRLILRGKNARGEPVVAVTGLAGVWIARG